MIGWNLQTSKVSPAETSLNFEKIDQKTPFIPLEIRAFVDASAGAVTYPLPPIVGGVRDYYIVKVDVSVNAVTITAAGTDTIEGAASMTLPAQYDWVKLVANNGVWYRMP